MKMNVGAYRSGIAAIAVMMVGVAAPAVAANVKAAVETSVRLGYSSNPFLSAGNDLASGSVTGSIDPSLSWVTEKGSVVLRGNYDRTEYFRNYDGVSGYGGGLDVKQKLSPKLDVFGGLRYDSRIIGQNDDTITGVPGSLPVDDTDVNLIGTRQRSNTLQGSAGYNWQVSPRDTITGNVSAALTRYPNRPVGSDSDNLGGTIGYQRAISEKTKVGLSGTVYHISYDTPGLDTLVMQPNVTFSTSISETWSFDASLGISFTDLKVPGPGNDQRNTGWAGTADLCHRGRMNNFCFSASRQVSASGFGGTVTRDQLAFNMHQQLTERLGFNGGGSFSQSESQLALIGKRRYVSAQGGLDYKLFPNVVVGASAHYRDVFGNRTFLGAGQDIKADIGGEVSATLVLPRSS
ncbi:hypothetical protein [Sphingomonas montanisoli]|uniref:Outer membrane beta-barrel protein n=1 Tax=Sphingomonas montanisoli TaxID=2606412 RepID=A0A5D9CCY1_9SPHN|nr:hypothetical protein [Sphingomonas montanisoli]TZG27965.1 hypothetical protein FYJ91_10540 [Sphingomonas montanisoli]